METQSNYKRVYYLLKNNWLSFLLFQLVMIVAYQVLTFLRQVFVAILKSSFQIDLLAQDNLLGVLKNPWVLGSSILVLLVELFFLFFGIIGIYKIFSASIKGEVIKIRTLLKEIFSSFLKLLSFRRIMIIPIVVLTMLFSYIPLFSNVSEGLRIPEFIADWFYQDALYKGIYIGIRVLMSILWIWVVFVMTGMFLENKTLKEARRESLALLKRKKSKSLFILFGIIILLALLATLVFFVIIHLTYVLNNHAPLGALLKANWRATLYIPLLAGILQMALIVTTHCSYHSIRVEKAQIRSKKRVRAMVFKAVLILFSIVFIESYNEYYNPNVIFLDQTGKPKIVAHRAGGTFAPENSLEALKISVDSKITSSVEIDVQLTKDAEVILNHDPNLSRITGNSSKASELTLKEIKNLKTKTEEGTFTGPPIPTLNEFIDRAGEMHVMIELKETKERNSELLEKVLAMVKEKNFVDKAMIASMDRNVLMEAKAKMPKIRTVLISTVLLGASFNEDYIDIYSIEAITLSKGLVEDAHAKNKKIYVWTINTQRGVKSVLKSFPDGIVTDNVFIVDYAMSNFEDNFPYQSDIMNYYLRKSMVVREQQS